MRVLVTNDDGVSSEGLWALAKRVVDDGYEAVVAAPTTDMTGMGAAIGGDLHGGELRAQRIVRKLQLNRGRKHDSKKRKTRHKILFRKREN